MYAQEDGIFYSKQVRISFRLKTYQINLSNITQQLNLLFTRDAFYMQQTNFAIFMIMHISYLTTLFSYVVFLFVLTAIVN